MARKTWETQDKAVEPRNQRMDYEHAKSYYSSQREWETVTTKSSCWLVTRNFRWLESRSMGQKLDSERFDGDWC